MQALSLSQVADEFTPTTLLKLTLMSDLEGTPSSGKEVTAKKGKDGETVAGIEHNGESSCIS